MYPSISSKFLSLALVVMVIHIFEVKAINPSGNKPICRTDNSRLNHQSARSWKPCSSLSMRGGGDSPLLSSAAATASTSLTPSISGGSSPTRKKKRRRKIPITQEQGIPRPTLNSNTPSMPNSLLPPSSKTATTTAAPIIDPADSTAQKMPTLFSDKESIYDRYSAALAATESLRRIRDSYSTKSKRKTRSSSGSSSNSSASTSAVNVDSSSWRSWLSKDGAAAAAKEKVEEGDSSKEAYKRACAQYVLNSSKAIQALGLSVSQFNQLGRTISKDDLLKERVMEQAYLYRMASTINMQKIPLIEDPNSKQLLKSHKRRRVQMFVRSITEIEELRGEQIERLKQVLQLKSLPKGIDLCDPAVMPLLSPKVRAVCEAFPHQAEEIVKRYGLNSDEFNGMLEETRGNPIFRWRVEKFRKLHDETKKGGNGKK